MEAKKMWLVQSLVQSTPIVVVHNQDGTDHATVGFLPVFESKELAEAYAISVGGEPTVIDCWFAKDDQSITPNRSQQTT